MTQDFFAHGNHFCQLLKPSQSRFDGRSTMHGLERYNKSYFTDNNFRTLITGCLTGAGHLMEVQL